MQVNFQSLDQGNTSSGIYSTWRCVFLRSLTAINMICRYAFFPGCLNVMDVYEVNNVCENKWIGVSGVVTWEHFLEALSERFRWVLGSCLSEASSAVHLNK